MSSQTASQFACPSTVWWNREIGSDPPDILSLMDSTNEFSFILKPSAHGMGVFVTHDVKKRTHLRLFGNEKEFNEGTRLMDINEVPELFQGLCINNSGTQLICPEDFGTMPIGWYLNHSKESNATRYALGWYASRDIVAGEEILVDYNSLDEPQEAREDYYRG